MYEKMKNQKKSKAMYGAMIGDIVGSIYEFDNIKTKEFPFFSKRCFFTDDTVMTLAIANVLCDEYSDGKLKQHTADEWRKLFSSEMRRIGRHYPNCGYGNSFYTWVMRDDVAPYGSKGNGSAMRVSPVAYFASSLEECEFLAILTADISHNHPDGIAGAVVIAGATYLALHGASKEEIREYTEKFYHIGFTLDKIRPNYYFGHFQACNEGTVPYALEAFFESDSFEDCIRNIVSIGGDTDTLGAIGGAVAEAYYGIPDPMIDMALEYLSPELREIVDKLEKIS